MPRRKVAVTLARTASPPLDGGQAMPAFRPDQLLPVGRYPTMTIVHDRVRDPHPHPDTPLRSIVVARNIKSDILGTEHAHGRISDAALAVGREIEQALTILGGSGQSQWLQGDRIDPGRRVELAVVAGLDRADAALATMRRVYRVAGMIMGDTVVDILRARLTFAEVAHKRGEPSTRGTQYVARLFRDGLEAMANCNNT